MPASPKTYRALSRIALAAVAVAAATLAWAQPATPAAPADHAKGRILVLTRAGLPESAVDALLKPHGGKGRRLGRSDLHVVELPAGASEADVVRALQKNPHLKFAELDRKVPHALTPNDPYAGSEWHLNIMRTGSAWDSANGTGVTIAILDTGVLPTHQDLAANLVPGWNTYDNNNNTADVYGHGTAVAGTAGGILNNGTGVAGVAGDAKIMPIRVSDTSGMGYFSTIASGVTWAAEHGARVVNASFAGVFTSSAVANAAAYLKSKGGLLVVAAGNNGINENAPASSSMIVVSATDASDALAAWSSYGPMVSVAAPGVGIWTTSADGSYRSASGTSFASPAVAGVVALMMSANPALGASQIESLLYSTATDLGAAGRDIYYGYGRVDAAAAVAAARNAVAADTLPPTVAIASPAGGSTVSGIVAVDVSASDNVGVARIDLKVNGTVVASDVSAPYGFAFDSTRYANGSITLAAVAVDAAGNSRTSASTTLNIANATAADTTPPKVSLLKPGAGAQLSGTVQIGASATDNMGPAGITQTLSIDGVVRASATGGSLSYSWNTRKDRLGAHTITVVARDAAGNASSASVSVNRIK